MTKKEAREKKAAWQKALIEGRVVRWSETQMTSYPSIAARDAALEKAAKGGYSGKIVEIKNPVGSAKATRLYKSFMLRAPTRSKIVNVPALPKEALAIGFVSGIIYESDRGGGANSYRHDFTKGSRPLLAVSNDGQQLVLIGGSYQFTKRGITDK